MRGKALVQVTPVMTPLPRISFPSSTLTSPWPAKSVMAQPAKVLPSKRLTSDFAIAVALPDPLAMVTSFVFGGEDITVAADGCGECVLHPVDRNTLRQAIGHSGRSKRVDAVKVGCMGQAWSRRKKAQSSKFKAKRKSHGPSFQSLDLRLIAVVASRESAVFLRGEMV